MTIAGLPYQNPLSYTGPQMNVVPIKVFFREPAMTDTKYRIGSIALIGKNPSTGTEGELWYLSKFNSSGEAEWLQLLTGASSPGIDSITTDDGAPAVEPDGNGNVNIVGGVGCTVAGQGPGDTVTINVSGGGHNWVVAQNATQAMVVNTGYIVDRMAGITFTLPTTSAVGDIVRIVGMTGLWTLACNAGETMYIGNTNATITTGTLVSTNAGDCVELVCITVDTNWRVMSMVGNITVT